MRLRNYIYLFSFSLFLLSSCQNETPPSSEHIAKIFSQLTSSDSGIDFSNQLKEDSTINYFTYPYIYMGGGVAVGDVNNDGFSDLYFTGNMVENKLYLNNGANAPLSFTDITTEANVGADDRWVTGVTMADVNADGWMDIYVSVSGKFTTKKNMLYLNNGVLKNGVPSFTESAEQRGVADPGSSTQGTFFDYDNDGDLDLYVANYPYTSFKTPNYSYNIFINKKDPEKSDKLYANDGNGFFTDVTAASGIQNFGLSLSATAADYNNDGYQDIYVSNDFATPDFLYLNNGDGTFTDHLKSATNHISYFGMGTDANDFNNDGLVDLLQMDMTPSDNRRNKANMASMNIPAFWEIVNMDMHYQYMQNALQLNQGISANGIPHYSDISRMAGLASTDWSWAGLFADLDNDGWKDIFITNGTRRDINNKDYFNAIDKAPYAKKKTFNNLDLTLEMPSERIDNYAFKNMGDLDFKSVNKDWGISFEGFSNGAAYADLDNDGDLEIIINNIDDKAIIFKNNTREQNAGNFLTVQLNGPEKNPQGLGTKVKIKTAQGIQYQSLTLTRGFQSSVDPKIHFGLGTESTIEYLEVVWPDGKMERLNDIQFNSTLVLIYKNELASTEKIKTENIGWFKTANDRTDINFKHIENPFDDYAQQVLLPHTYSANGPGITKGDVNGDNLEDFYIGAAVGNSGALFLQNENGTFYKSKSNPWEADKSCEDMSALFFDADGDRDLDLYVVSGGSEFREGHSNLKDRLYLNDGKGAFTKTINALPNLSFSGSVVRSADFDQDGDLDLFVGGKIIPGLYPNPANSYLLRNEGNEQGVPSFKNITEEIAPDLIEIGLVSDAIWCDFNNDNLQDLVIVGEWMPISFFENTGNKFIKKTEKYGMDETTGWWYSIAANDFDKDGDLDFIAGNLGLNYKYQANEKETFDVFVSDFDKNGQQDIVLGYYNDGVQYPVRGRQCSAEQIPTIKYKYKSYNEFASASLTDIYTEQDLSKSKHFKAKTFAHTYIENTGAGTFALRTLSNATQVSSINDIIIEDVNKDGHMDVIAAGNLYGSEVETTRNDAGYGYYLEGDGKGNFDFSPFSKSGLLLKGDVKDLEIISTSKGQLILAAKNNDELQAVLIQKNEN